MTTGWKWVDSNGEEYRSLIYAARAMLSNPSLTFEFSELDMSGTHVRDATEEVKKACDLILVGEEYH